MIEAGQPPSRAVIDFEDVHWLFMMYRCWGDSCTDVSPMSIADYDIAAKYRQTSMWWWCRRLWPRLPTLMMADDERFRWGWPHFGRLMSRLRRGRGRGNIIEDARRRRWCITMPITPMCFCDISDDVYRWCALDFLRRGRFPLDVPIAKHFRCHFSITRLPNISMMTLSMIIDFDVADYCFLVSVMTFSADVMCWWVVKHFRDAADYVSRRCRGELIWFSSPPISMSMISLSSDDFHWWCVGWFYGAEDDAVADDYWLMSWLSFLHFFSIDVAFWLSIISFHFFHFFSSSFLRCRCSGFDYWCLLVLAMPPFIIFFIWWADDIIMRIIEEDERWHYATWWCDVHYERQPMIKTLFSMPTLCRYADDGRCADYFQL